MEYTKENIDGVVFICPGYPEIYTVDLSKKQNVIWKPGGNTYIDAETIAANLNKGSYVPVERNELCLIYN